jgi:hypothetical protein
MTQYEYDKLSEMVCRGRHPYGVEYWEAMLMALRDLKASRPVDRSLTERIAFAEDMLMLTVKHKLTQTPIHYDELPISGGYW